MRLSYLIGIFLIVVSCGKVEPREVDTTFSEKKKFEMYQLSEMSLLMEQMYVDNQRLRNRIADGEEIGEFPTHFLEIHKAALTDETENDDFFKEQAALFIKAQQLIYEDPTNA